MVFSASVAGSLMTCAHRAQIQSNVVHYTRTQYTAHNNNIEKKKADTTTEYVLDRTIIYHII